MCSVCWVFEARMNMFFGFPSPLTAHPQYVFMRLSLFSFTWDHTAVTVRGVVLYPSALGHVFIPEFLLWSVEGPPISKRFPNTHCLASSFTPATKPALDRHVTSGQIQHPQRRMFWGAANSPDNPKL